MGLPNILLSVWPCGYWFVHMSAANVVVPNLCANEIGLRAQEC